jgi:hypothetical protein
MIVMRNTKSLLLIAAALVICRPDVHAQPTPQGPPNALQGFSQNRDQPVHIESATLEVRDLLALYRGQPGRGPQCRLKRYLSVR